MKKLTMLDGIVWLAAVSFVVIVIYRYRTQQYFDLYGLLWLGMCIMIYRQYRGRPKKSEIESEFRPAGEKPPNQPTEPTRSADGSS